MTPLRSLFVAARVVAVRPRLWTTAVREACRFVPDVWWRRRPWLPLPDPALLRWRALAQYGDPDRVVDPDDLAAWLDWCRSENRRR